MRERLMHSLDVLGAALRSYALGEGEDAPVGAVIIRIYNDAGDIKEKKKEDGEASAEPEKVFILYSTVLSFRMHIYNASSFIAVSCSTAFCTLLPSPIGLPMM
jgi:hypothetical protein